MRISVKRFNSFFIIGSMVVATGMMACNNGDYGNSSSATADSTNAANASATDTISAKPVAKVKKGRASISMTANSSTADNTAIVKAPKMVKDKDGVYSQTEVMPAYPGGESALQQFVESNVNYPQPAMDGNVEGTVRVSFVVDEKGSVTKPQVQGNTNPGSGLDAEAMRVVQQMPKWTPGMVKGKAVKTRLELPITFKLSETE